MKAPDAIHPLPQGGEGSKFKVGIVVIEEASQHMSDAAPEFVVSAHVRKQNVGNAGEYYVAALLSAMDYTATITLGRAERYDILAVSPAGKPYKFSVTARLKKESNAFNLSKRDESGYEDAFFYVFVRLNELKEQPEYWVVPSKRVSEVIADAHKKWLADAHNNTPMRNIPIEVKGSDKKYFPAGWTAEMAKYKNTFSVVNG